MRLLWNDLERFDMERFDLYHEDVPDEMRRAFGVLNYHSRPISLEGEVAVRTKRSHPYSYDPFLVYLAGGVSAKDRINGCEYTDRLAGWDRSKYERLCRKHLGRGRWSEQSSRAIEAFLHDWCNDFSITLISVQEWCNPATGYSTWSLHYETKKDGNE